MGHADNRATAHPTAAAREPSALEGVKVREVAGVFRAREDIDKAVDTLLLAGFDQSDIDLMATADAVKEKLGGIYLSAEELAHDPRVPRRAYIAREGVRTALGFVAGILTYVGATAAALGVVASGGALAASLAAASAGAAAGGGVGVLIAKLIGSTQAKELETQMELGGLVLWVRVRSPEREATTQKILHDHGADAVHVHEIEIEKRLEDIPLSSLRPDPWLGDERLGEV